MLQLSRVQAYCLHMGESEISATGDQTEPLPAARFERSSADRIREREFPLAVRGYDRHAVDEFLAEIADLVAELEGRQSRESVVQRALDEVGEETAGILQRAHETADEITSRSRAQADARLQRAEREADIARRDADVYAEQVVGDTRLLWDERMRLLEDIRQLADDVLATADEAAERVTLPEALIEPEAEQPGLIDPADSAQDTIESPFVEMPLTDPVEDPEADPEPTNEVELNLLPGGAREPEPQSDPASGPDSGDGPEAGP
jgi:DivIVA domain-containing protein